MSSKTKRLGIFSLFMMLLAAGLIYLLKNVDVASVGFFERVVGLSSINKFFFELFGYSILWYKITNWPGIALILLVVFVFFIIGLQQLIKRKSIFKVDKNILALGVIYFITFVAYILFEKLSLNFRPIIVPGEEVYEPSFPSSHTLFAVVVMGTAMMECSRLIKNIRLRRMLNCVLFASMMFIIIGRIISGVHWFTDILGGIFIGSALLLLYAWYVSLEDNKSSFKKFKVNHVNSRRM